jgi:hypothetical protein
MESIVISITNALVSKEAGYKLSNGVNIEFTRKLKGDSVDKRYVEARAYAEELFNDVIKLNLL